MSSINICIDEFFIHIGIFIPVRYIIDMVDDARYKAFLNILESKMKREWSGKSAMLAKKAGISQGNLSKIKNNKTKATYETQVKLLEALDVDYQDLYTPNKTLEASKNKQKDEQAPQYTVRIDDKETWKHFKVIKRFKSKRIALEMNEVLADYEEKNSALKFAKLLTKIVDWIEAEENATGKEPLKELSNKAANDDV